MNNVYFGIFIGVFLCLAGQRFLVVMIKMLKERKKDNETRLKELIREVTKKE